MAGLMSCRCRIVHHIAAVAYSPDSHHVLTGDRDGTITKWDARKHTRVAEGFGDPSLVNLAFSPDGNTFASASEDGTVRLWQTATMRSAAAFEGPSVRPPTESASSLILNSNVLVFAARDAYSTPNVRIRAWDPKEDSDEHRGKPGIHIERWIAAGNY